MADPDSNNSAPVIGIDLGGTNMQLGVVDVEGEIIARFGDKTEAGDGLEGVLGRIVAGVKEVTNQSGSRLDEIAAIGIGVPAAMDIRSGTVLSAPNLGWSDVPLREMLIDKLGRPVTVENDVNAAAWGEYSFGAARDRGDMLGVWIGTGVGGGLVLNANIYHGSFGTAGEIGHTVIRPDGKPRRRTIEDLCSRTGIGNLLRERLKAGEESMTHAMLEKYNQVTTDLIVRSYRQNDALVVFLVDQAAQLLGVGIANWVTVLSIDTVVIGGGITEALGDSYLDSIRSSFRQNVFPERCRAAKILPTALTSNAGLLGAADLARRVVDKH